MSVLEMKMPSPGESITEVEIAQWLVEDGDYVEIDQAVAEIDSDKATLELPAEKAGIITLLAAEGDTITVGAIVCKINTSAKAPKKVKTELHSQDPKVAIEPPEANPIAIETVDNSSSKATPVAKAMMSDNGVLSTKVKGSGDGGKIIKSDVVSYLSGGIKANVIVGWGGTRDESSKKMSSLRRKIAKRLVSV